MDHLRMGFMACCVAALGVFTACSGDSDSASSRTGAQAKVTAQVGDPEPNDTKESATYLNGDFVGLSLSTSEIDDDWFRFAASGKSLIFASLAFDNANADLDATLHVIRSVDSQGVITSDQVATYSQVGSMMELLYVAEDAPAEYLLHVIANSVDGATSLVPFPQTAYDLHLTTQAPELAGAPILAPIGDRFRAPSHAMGFTMLGASASPSASLVYSLTGLPNGASFDASTGAFSWTPNAGDVGVHELLARVTDTSANLSDWEQLTITVSEEVDGSFHRFMRSNNGLQPARDPLAYADGEWTLTSSPLTSFELTDLDGDGLRDIIWHNITDGRIRWAMNQGASFDRDIQHSVGFSGVQGFQVTDFLPAAGNELVAYSSTTGLIRVFSLMGGVGPSHLTQIQGAVGASHMLVLDYDDDQQPDIVQIVPSTQSVMLYRASTGYQEETLVLGSVPVALLEPRGLWSTGVMVFAAEPNKLFHVADQSSAMAASDVTPPNMPSMLKLTGAAYTGVSSATTDGTDILVFADDFLTTTGVQVAQYVLAGGAYTKVAQGIVGAGNRWPLPTLNTSTNAVDLLMGGIDANGDLLWQRYDGTGGSLDFATPSAATGEEAGQALFGGSAVLPMAPYHHQGRITGALVVVEDVAPEHPLYTEFNHINAMVDAVADFATYYSALSGADPALAASFQAIGSDLQERLTSERLYTADLSGEWAVYDQSRRRLLIDWDTYFHSSRITATTNPNHFRFWDLLGRLVALGAQHNGGHVSASAAGSSSIEFLEALVNDYNALGGSSWASQNFTGITAPPVGFLFHGWERIPYDWSVGGLTDLTEALIDSHSKGFAAPTFTGNVAFPGFGTLDPTIPGPDENNVAALLAAATANLAPGAGNAIGFVIENMYTDITGAKCIEVTFTVTVNEVTSTLGEPVRYCK